MDKIIFRFGTIKRQKGTWNGVEIRHLFKDIFDLCIGIHNDGSGFPFKGNLPNDRGVDINTLYDQTNIHKQYQKHTNNVFHFTNKKHTYIL